MYDQFQSAPMFGAIALLVSFGVCFVVLFPLYWWWKRTKAQTSELVAHDSFELVESSDSTQYSAQLVTPAVQSDEHCEDVIKLNVGEPVEQQESIAEFTHRSSDNEQETKQGVIHIDEHANAQHSNDLLVLSNDAVISPLEVQSDERNEDSKQGDEQTLLELQEEIVKLATNHHKDEQEVQQNVIRSDETPEIAPPESLPTLDLRDVQLLKTKTKVAVKASDITIPVPKSIRKRKVRGHDSFYICDLQSVFSLTLPEGVNSSGPMKRTRNRTARRKPR
jgi:hypothetical protein